MTDETADAARTKSAPRPPGVGWSVPLTTILAPAAAVVFVVGGLSLGTAHELSFGDLLRERYAPGEGGPDLSRATREELLARRDHLGRLATESACSARA